MRRLQIAWANWRRQAAIDELVEMQARADVGPIYLCGLIHHITDLDWRISNLQGATK